MSNNLNETAEQALQDMLAAGFENAQISVSVSEQNELNIMHNEPSLLRSTEDHALNLTGILDNRKASMALTDMSPGAVKNAIQSLFGRAQLAPQDDANVVSENESTHYEQGPVEGDMDLLALKAEELIEYRARKTPRMQIEEGDATHRIARECLMTSGGSQLSCVVGSYSMSVFGAATEDGRSSSFNYTGGTAIDLSGAHASELFGIGIMMAETEKQIDTRSIDKNFTGDIILAPTAVMDLLGWLLGQLRDFALISNSSLYKDRVGDQIASDLFTVRSRFDAPGHAPYTADAFNAKPLTLVESGKLNCLIPSLYGSIKTGLKHVPASSGWTVDTGDHARAELIAGITQGAMVNRLSMGSPGANGDFSGVIKNSFMIENGETGHALSETMIAGNMSDMLNDIVAVSKEHLDLGGQDFPWIRIANLNFS